MPFLNILQIILAILLAASILMQAKGSDVGAAFGGGGSAIQHTKRGAEKFLFWSTIILAALFFASVAANIFIA